MSNIVNTTWFWAHWNTLIWCKSVKKPQEIEIGHWCYECGYCTTARPLISAVTMLVAHFLKSLRAHMIHLWEFMNAKRSTWCVHLYMWFKSVCADDPRTLGSLQAPLDLRSNKLIGKPSSIHQQAIRRCITFAIRFKGELGWLSAGSGTSRLVWI